MHIRDGILSPEVCAVAGVVSAAAIGYSLRQLSRQRDSHAVPLTGMVAALVFAGQMVNFPLFGLPVSGHLLGGVLAAALVGPWAGCLAISVVLIVQAVLFADGGLMSLGVNILNMAVIGCWGGGAMYESLRRLVGTNLRGSLVAVIVAAYLSVLAAAACFCGEFVASAHDIPFPVQPLTWFMVLYHALIGIGEAAITGGVLAFVWSRRPQLLAASETSVPSWRPLTAAGVAVACVIAAVLSPWASEWPDGLEAVGDRVGFNDLGQDRVLLLSDYALPVPSGWEAVSVSAAGVLGTLVVLCVGWLLISRVTPSPVPVPDASHAG